MRASRNALNLGTETAPGYVWGDTVCFFANWVETGAGAMPGSQGQHRAALSTRVEYTSSLRAG